MDTEPNKMTDFTTKIYTSKSISMGQLGPPHPNIKFATHTPQPGLAGSDGQLIKKTSSNEPVHTALRDRKFLVRRAYGAIYAHFLG